MNSTRTVVALAACFISTSAFAGRVIERPGVGYAPAFICIATTVRADGHTKQSSVFRSSGNPNSDRFALRFARHLKFIPPEGQKWDESQRRERDAHLLIRTHGNATFAFRLFELTEPLPPICHSPYESVARDAEINAKTPP